MIELSFKDKKMIIFIRSTRFGKRNKRIYFKGDKEILVSRLGIKEEYQNKEKIISLKQEICNDVIDTFEMMKEFFKNDENSMLEIEKNINAIKVLKGLI